MSGPNDDYYRAEVVFGGASGLAWDVDTDDPADYGPTLPLRFGWARPDPGYPAPPDHITATFGLIMAEAPDAYGLNEGDPVEVRVWFAPGPSTPADCEFSFYGRIAELTAQPHTLGMLYAVSCVGYTVDLAELDAGKTNYELDTPHERVQAILDDAGEQPWTSLVADPGSPGDFVARVADTKVPAWDLLQHTLSQALFNRPAGQLASGLLRASVDPLFSRRWWFLDYLDARHYTDGSPMPGLFELDPATGFWTVTITDPDPDTGVVDAALIETESARWRRAKQDRTTDTVVTGWWNFPLEQTLVETRSRRPAERILEQSTSVDTTYPGDLAEWWLPEQDDGNGWQADSFRFRLSEAPDDLPRCFHNGWSVDLDPAMLSRPWAVANIPTEHNPSNGYVAGQLVAVELTVDAPEDGKRVWVDFRLSRSLPRPVPLVVGEYEPSPLGYLSWADIDPTCTWADIDPNLSWYELRLARDI